MAVKKYLKFDSENGYLDNKDDINYFAANQMRKVAFGRMLGDFDENGLYVIKEKIVEELIKMPKVIVEMVEDADLIRSTVKADSFFHFMLSIEDNKAVFKLLEKLQYQSNRNFNSGLYSNINEYVLDEVVIPDKDFDRNALYQKYNISTENNGDVLSIFDMDELSLAIYFNIIEKLKGNYLVQNELMLKEKELEEIEADYFEEMLSVLSEFEDFNNKVIGEVQDELAEKHSFVIISKPFYQHTVNEILDGCIESFINTLSPEQREQFIEKMREVKARYYEKFKKLVPIEISQKSGVRFDANQILEETIMGELTKEIETKGYTSSDVRKIVIKEDELQLSINRIKEDVKQNEEMCKRDNAKAKDIVTGRKRTAEFYKSLEARKKVNMLSPDTTLIEQAIGGKSVEKSSGLIAAAVENGGQAVKADAAKTSVGAGKTTGGKTAGGKTTGGKTTGKTTGGKTSEKSTGGKGTGGKGAETVKKGTATNSNKRDGDLASAAMYGSGIKREEPKKEEAKKEQQKKKNSLLAGFKEDRRGFERSIKANVVEETATKTGAHNVMLK